ncbi:alpha/beta hydrolase [Draconibacterium sediminis]|uniref:alpha/beta hydrolase n=1 Tax=Draconibacterium sediminis TaxID=1544798 RepID=UPI0026EE8248|nr:alpha/beta hydrolase [Draconibacterium sediminis]
MHINFKHFLFLIAIVFLHHSAKAQLEITYFNEHPDWQPQKVPFFTNRPIAYNKDGSFNFKNSFTDKTNTLYFCHYNFDTDSIGVNFRVINMSDKYPQGKVDHNFFYQLYEYQRLERGIKNFYFIVGGYGKSFNKQVHSYMRRLKANYGDSLFHKASITVFAWGTEDKAYRYYRAVRKSKNGASDFAIFQHMLDEFISDDEYFKTHPKDLTISILFSSIGNELFRQYVLNRKKQNIPFVKTYTRISFVGSVAPRDAFEKGNAFYELNQLADTVDVYVNSKDILLKLSSVAHLKNRMGNKGPKSPEKLPDYINVMDIKDIITIHDMSGLGHDYLLTNPVLQDEILQNINKNIEAKEDD